MLHTGLHTIWGKYSLNVELGLSSIDAVLGKSCTEVVHGQRRSCFVLWGMSRARQWKRGWRRQTLAPPGPETVARARPLAAFVRIRACWYASEAMSETNFWAARERRRLLKDMRP